MEELAADDDFVAFPGEGFAGALRATGEGDDEEEEAPKAHPGTVPEPRG